jgi:TolB protein
LRSINKVVIVGCVALVVLLVALVVYQALATSFQAAPVSVAPVLAHQAEYTSETEPAPAGRLAYIGGDGNVYVTTADRASITAVTNDATTAPEGMGLSYHRISWSRDGRLAFAAVIRQAGDRTGSKIYVAEVPGAPAQVLAQSDKHFVIYIYWSPVPCPDQPACRNLAYLIEATDSLGLHLVAVGNDRVENRRIGLGRPFYFSWSPDGWQILWHTGGARRFNREAQLAVYQVDRERTQIWPEAPGLFLAPAWSPQGDRWLGVTADDMVDQLQSFPAAGLDVGAADPPVTLSAATNSQAVFAWSPDGQQVAYARRANGNDPFYGPVHVVDLKTGQSRRITDVGFRILGFFWSPDGQRLGYLIRQALPDSAWMQWRVYDLARAKDRGFKAFNPSSQMRSVIGSFNQYAQSHRFWSPDGRYLVYAERTPDLIEQVWLIDTRSEDGSNASLIDEGTIGFWSWN